MIKWLRYHLSYLFDKKNILILSSILIVVTFFLLFIGGVFESYLERLIKVNEYLNDYDRESFIFLNMILSIWVMSSSKEMFNFDEPHVKLIHKGKYITSKVITYALYYVLIGTIFFFVYQVIRTILFGVYRYPFNYLGHLIHNMLLIHLLCLLFSGKNKSILTTILFTLFIIGLDRLLLVDYYLLDIFRFYYPIYDLNFPLFGYIHSIILMVLFLFIAILKHLDYDA